MPHGGCTPPQVYVRLGERLHLTDHLAVLAVLVNKIVSNLKHRSECAEVTAKTLALFSDLAGGYCSGKLLLKLDHVHMILANHTADEFPFLAVEANFRLRTPTPFEPETARPLASISIACAACRDVCRACTRRSPATPHPCKPHAKNPYKPIREKNHA